MVKVIRPFRSQEATGKFGKHLRYSIKNGKTSVHRNSRKNKQANKSPKQGDQRMFFSTVSQLTNKLGSQARLELEAITTHEYYQALGYRKWKPFLTFHLTQNNHDWIKTGISEYNLRTATVQQLWQLAASSIGLINSKITYGSIPPITAGQKLYTLALIIGDLGFMPSMPPQQPGDTNATEWANSLSN